MADKNHPRRGSLAYKPQVQASRLYPQLSAPDGIEDGAVAGFAGYKAGMTRVLRIDDEPESPTKGQEVADAVTVLEFPPLQVYGVRAYHRTADGTQPLTDVIADNVSDTLERATDVPNGNDNADLVEDRLDDITDIRLLVHTQPQESGLGKKTPEVFEAPIGGDAGTQWETAQDLLGTELSAGDVIEPGQYVDVMGVTKGKGMQGPVQRHGVKTLSHKTQKSNRKAGNIGPWHPDHTSWKVPQPGRAGANARTELNKRVLAVGDDPADVTPEGGFNDYGHLEDSYVLVKGSVPGPSKRLIMVRPAVRGDDAPRDPDITHIRT